MTDGNNGPDFRDKADPMLISGEPSTDETKISVEPEQKTNAVLTDPDHELISKFKQAYHEGILPDSPDMAQIIGLLETVQNTLRAHQEALEQTRREAFIDPLTGLQNRAEFERIAHTWVERKIDPNNRDYVFVIDVNKFKRYNDTYGHNGGDDILREIAKQIGLAVRGDDCAIRIEEAKSDEHNAIRYGGDEFCVVARNVAPNMVEVIARRLYNNVAEATIQVQAEDGTMVEESATIAVGYSVVGPSVAGQSGLIRAFAKADKALYSSKQLKDSGEVTIVAAEPDQPVEPGGTKVG